MRCPNKGKRTSYNPNVPGKQTPRAPKGSAWSEWTGRTNQSERAVTFNTTVNFNSLNVSDNSINLHSSNSSDNSINLNSFSHSNRGHSNRNPILTYFRVLCNYLHLCFVYPFHALYINNCCSYLSAYLSAWIQHKSKTATCWNFNGLRVELYFS